MNCKYCGNEIEENAKFCSKCGKIIDELPSTVTPDRSEPSEPSEIAARRDSLGGEILKFSIMSLVFTWTFFLSFLGIVFAIIAKRKVSAYTEELGETEGRATVGKHLATAGLIAGCVMTGILALYIIVLVIAVIGAILTA